MQTARRLAGLVGVSVCAYALVVRPRLLRWGATDEEVRRPFPGGDLIPGGERSATMAVTIEAPTSRVWPWLVQMGADRAGWYSWDHLDNLGHPSAERIHPEWQELSVGDHLAATPDGSVWWEVAALEPERFLALRISIDLRWRPLETVGPRPGFYSDSLWCFLLEELPGGRTRLVSERLRVHPATTPPDDRELRLLGARPLDHADTPVREPETARRALSD